jgi:hypothetical protein
MSWAKKSRGPCADPSFVRMTKVKEDKAVEEQGLARGSFLRQDDKGKGG